MSYKSATSQFRFFKFSSRWNQIVLRRTLDRIIKFSPLIKSFLNVKRALVGLKYFRWIRAYFRETSFVIFSNFLEFSQRSTNFINFFDFPVNFSSNVSPRFSTRESLCRKFYLLQLQRILSNLQNYLISQQNL